jgi:hypothetical protein
MLQTSATTTTNSLGKHIPTTKVKVYGNSQVKGKQDLKIWVTCTL